VAAFACALLLRVSLVGIAGAAEPAKDEQLFRHWAVGIQVGIADRPTGHLGIPLGGGEMGSHLPLGLVGGYQMSPRTAVTLGLGLPTGAMGVAFWAGFDASLRLVADPRQIVALALYEDAGLQLGFAGPDYYARHENEFVGFGYAVAGPWALAIRLPVGLRASWLQDRFDVFVEGVDVLAMTPSFESLFELAGGGRFKF
jgi:hypothetical protein